MYIVPKHVQTCSGTIFIRVKKRFCLMSEIVDNYLNIEHVKHVRTCLSTCTNEILFIKCLNILYLYERYLVNI